MASGTGDGPWDARTLAGMPHRHPALLVASIVAVTDGGGVVMCAPHDGLDALQLIEAAAQALAALAAARAAAKPGDASGAVGGMLTAINRLKIEDPAPPGMPVGIMCQSLSSLGQMSAHFISINDMDRQWPLISGEWSVMSQEPSAGSEPYLKISPHLTMETFSPSGHASHAMRPFQDAACALSERQAGVGEATAKLCFPPELAVFAGHFPGRPVVPGVHLIAAVLLTAVPGARLVAIERTKWRRALLPGMAATVHADWRSDGDRLVIVGRVDGPDGRCCDCRLEAIAP